MMSYREDSVATVNLVLFMMSYREDSVATVNLVLFMMSYREDSVATVNLVLFMMSYREDSVATVNLVLFMMSYREDSVATVNLVLFMMSYREDSVATVNSVLFMMSYREDSVATVNSVLFMMSYREDSVATVNLVLFMMSYREDSVATVNLVLFMMSYREDSVATVNLVLFMMSYREDSVATVNLVLFMMSYREDSVATVNLVLFMMSYREDSVATVNLVLFMMSYREDSVATVNLVLFMMSYREDSVATVNSVLFMMSYREDSVATVNSVLFMTSYREDSVATVNSVLFMMSYRDMFIIGLSDKRIQESLFRESNLTLAKVVTVCQTAETTRKQAKSTQKGKTPNVDVNIDNVQRQSPREYDKSMIQKCKYCSYIHKRRSCPAYGKLCNLCKKKNHFSVCCSKRNKTKKEKYKKVDRISQTVPNTSSEEEYEHFFIGTNDLIAFKEENDWCIDLNTNGSVVNFKIDTGAQANVLPWKVCSKLLKRPKLIKSKVKLTAYNGTDIHVRGSCIAHLDYKRSSIPVLFNVAEIDSSPVIGLNTSSKLNLIKRVMKIKQDTVDLPDHLLSFTVLVK